MDRIDTQANETLKQELREKWDETTYEEIRKDPNLCGFTSEYLFACTNFKDFSSERQKLGYRAVMEQADCPYPYRF